jgi:hypothetical protein
VIPGLDGVRFWIWPEHALRVHGRTVRLSRRDGDLMAVLLSDPRRHWKADDLVDYAYSDPDDEPEWGRDTVRTRLSRLRRTFLRHGLVLRIDSRYGPGGGCRLLGFSPVAPRRRQAIPGLTPLPTTAPVRLRASGSLRVPLAVLAAARRANRISAEC